MSNEAERDVIAFLELIDAGLVAVEAAKKDVGGGEQSWLLEKYAQLALNLRTLRETTASGNMPRQSHGDIPAGSGLSLGKSVGEWCNNGDVFRRLADIEDYYRYRF